MPCASCTRYVEHSLDAHGFPQTPLRDGWDPAGRDGDDPGQWDELDEISLDALRVELDQAEARLHAARDAHQTRQARLQQLTDADRMARDARRAAETRLTEALRALSRAEADASLAQSSDKPLDLGGRPGPIQPLKHNPFPRHLPQCRIPSKSRGSDYADFAWEGKVVPKGTRQFILKAAGLK